MTKFVITKLSIMMSRRIPSKKQIRRITEHLIIVNQTPHFNIFRGLSKQQKKNLWIKILWLVMVTLCFSTCVYQIFNLVKYYLSTPVDVYVTSDVVEKDSMPLVTFCTDDTEDFNKLSPNGQNVGLNAADYWNARNTTTTIKSAYFTTMMKKRSTAILESVLTVPGICTNVYNNKFRPLRGSNLHLHVLFNKNLSSLLQFVGDRQSKIINTLSWREVPLRSLQRISIATEKYVFINRKYQPCLPTPKFEICQNNFDRNDSTRVMKLLHKVCRLPYMTSASDIPICNISQHISWIYKFTRDSFISKPERLTMSPCPRECTKSIYYLYGDYSIEPQLEVQLFTQSNVFPVMEERLSYDLTSLLCDIGGNLCLYLGLSCMTAANIATGCIWQIIHKKRTKQISRHPLYPKILKYVRYQLRNQKVCCLKSVENSKCNLYIKFLIVFVKVILVFVSVFVAGLRISHYLTYPTSNTVDLVQELKHPSISTVICSPSEIIQPSLNEFADVYNVPIYNIEFVDLLMKPMNISNFDILWLNSSNLDFFSNTFNRATNVTVFGNCTFFRYHELKFKSKTSKCKYRVFYILPNDIYNIKQNFIFYCNQKNIIRYKKQKLRRLNTPVNPCVTTEDSIQCEQNCYKTVLTKKNITCSLPFTPFISKPRCTSWQSAYLTVQAYLAAYLSTNPLRDCSCIVRCNEMLLLMRETAHYPNDHESSYYIEQGNIYWEIIEQHLSYSIINLLCDIGSNLGSIIGVSLLSTFHIVPTIFNAIIFIRDEFLYYSLRLKRH